MPAYFAFLTLMAYNIFLKEQTDVAIIEVGIGGQYDSTNLVRKPAVCGVTSLGMDHVSILGNTIEKIAWQKAGIFKVSIASFFFMQNYFDKKIIFKVFFVFFKLVMRSYSDSLFANELGHFENIHYVLVLPRKLYIFTQEKNRKF